MSFLIDIHKCGKKNEIIYSGYRQRHNLAKKKYLLDFSYWKNNLLRHDLEGMHIKNNIFYNILNAIMNIVGET